MDFGSVIREAWINTSRHRFLWVLGLFAVGGVSTCVPGRGPELQYQISPSDLQRFVPPSGQSSDIAASVVDWLTANVGLVVAAACLFALLAVAFLVVSMVAQGGMAKATTELARGRPITHKEAWRAGRRFFWRYVGLWLLLALIAFLVAVIVAIFVALPFGLAAAVAEARGPLAVLGAIFAVVMGLIAIPLVILASIVVTYAQRGIAANDSGPWAALREGVGLLRASLWTSALAWLIGMALGIGAGLAIVIAVGVIALAFGILGVGVYAAAGLSAAFFVYAAAAFVALLVGLWIVSAIVNTFFWSYWSIVYVRLGGPQGLTVLAV